MVTTYTKNNRSRNIKAILEEITKLQINPVVLVTTYMGHTRSRNMEATFRGNLKTIGYPSCNVSILRQDEGYTVKYTPLPEGVPKSKPQGNS